MSGVSGKSFSTSTCQALLPGGSIILFGQSQKRQLSYLVWVSPVGQILLNPNGTAQKMLMYLVLSLQLAQFSYRLCGIYKSALG